MEHLAILVVDDNHINRLYLKTILTQWHHHVTEADSGASALSVCRQQDFDLILMDIRMQPMDGITAAKNIKQLQNHNKTPIVAVSAEPLDCTPHPQFTRSLVKPLNKSVLKELIQNTPIKRPKKIKYDNPFDEKQALAISHGDTEIVEKLRTLFIKELPQEMQKIEQLHSNKLWSELDKQLHYLQGSARVCAAAGMTEVLENYRRQLADERFDRSEVCLMKFKKAAARILKQPPPTNLF